MLLPSPGSLHDPSEPWSLAQAVEAAREWKEGAASSLQSLLSNNVDRVRDLGPLGPLYFGGIYVLAEVLAVPALPFTAAAGYLFGVAGGTVVVLVSASIAAGISFMLGRTFLRWVPCKFWVLTRQVVTCVGDLQFLP